MSKSANGSASAASGGTQVGHNLTAMKKQIRGDLTKILQLREDETTPGRTRRPWPTGSKSSAFQSRLRTW